MSNEIFEANNFGVIENFDDYDEEINPFDQFLNVLEENEISASIKVKNVGVAVSGQGVTVHVGRSKKKQQTSLLEAKQMNNKRLTSKVNAEVVDNEEDDNTEE